MGQRDAEGFAVRVVSSGTDDVPLAIEISFVPGGKLEGCTAHNDAWIFEKDWGTMRVGGSTVRFGPGRGEHRYIQVRGALPRLEGTSVYLTSSTPFDHTIKFEWT